MSIFRPLLAEAVDLQKLVYPVLASPKLDGFRATMQEGILVSRNAKPLRNPAVTEKFKSIWNLDGELVVGDPRDEGVFNRTSSIVTTNGADVKDVMFFVFDLVSEDLFAERLAIASTAIDDMEDAHLVPHVLVMDEASLLHMEEDACNNGYEGLMLRAPKGRYKYGRSTVSEGLSLKMKRKMRSEAYVIGFVEQMHNANEAKLDNLGYTDRSSHKANLVPMGTLGALVVRDIKTGVTFNVGTGFSAADRQEIWDNRNKYLGKIEQYESAPYGVKDKPRHPSHVGFRAPEDM